MEKMETEKSTYSVSISVKCLSYDYIYLIFHSFVITDGFVNIKGF